MVIYSGFTHWKWWFSIAMLVYQRVGQLDLVQLFHRGVSQGFVRLATKSTKHALRAWKCCWSQSHWWPNRPHLQCSTNHPWSSRAWTCTKAFPCWSSASHGPMRFSLYSIGGDQWRSSHHHELLDETVSRMILYRRFSRYITQHDRI